MTVLKSAFFAITFMFAGSVAAPQKYESFRQLYDERCYLTGSEEPVVEYQGIFFNVVGQTTLNEVGVMSDYGQTKDLLLIELQDRRGDPNPWTDSFRSFDSRFKRPAGCTTFYVSSLGVLGLLDAEERFVPLPWQLTEASLEEYPRE